MRRIHPVTSIVTVFLISLATLILAASLVLALPGGATFREGYFTGATISSNNVNPVLNKDCGEPFTEAMANVGSIISRVESYYNGECSSRQNTLGAKFIMQTMIGVKNNSEALGWAGSDGDATADVAAWETYVKTLGVIWVESAAFDYNSGCYSNSGASDIYHCGTADGSNLDEYFVEESGSHDAVVFYDKSNGKVVYQLKSNCGNPIGSNSEKYVSNWNLSVGSSISGPDQNRNLTWTHTVRNNGPTSTSALSYYYQNSKDLGIGTGNGTGGGGNSGMAVQTTTFTSTYSIQSADAGKNLCRSTKASPSNSSGGGVIESIAACYLVPYSYTLTPSVSVNPAVVETGSQFFVNPNVNNSGLTISKPTDWKLTRIITASGTNDGTKDVASGTGVVFSASSDTNPKPNYTEVADYIAGTRICYTLSVTPHSSSDNTTNTSPQKCLTVGKKPKVQVWAGDVWARGLVNTSTTVKNNLTFGSWDEYGIFSAGKITGMASGSTFAITNGLSVNSICDYSILSFTNAGTAKDCTTSQSQGGLIGNYTISHSIPDVAASFPGNGAAIAGSVNLSTKNAGIYSASNLTLDPSTLPAGKSIIIKASGTVTIAGDQKYSSGPYTNITQLPQLVIIANKIVINSAVKNVDAWLIAVNKINKTGEIDTCEVVGNSINICVNPLIVNGPIMTDHLYLYRTAGSGTAGNSSDPAEVFNLRADSYLWAAAQSASNSRIQTVYTTELPPRF